MIEHRTIKNPKTLKGTSIEADDDGLSDGVDTAIGLDTGEGIAQVEGASAGEPSEEWILVKMIQNQSIDIHISVSGQMEPARRLLCLKFPLAERDFRYIARHSPFVPRTHVETFSLGFARMMQGDMLSAGHLLIPQLEHCLRHMLVTNGTQSAKMKNDLTQEDRSLSAILELFRDEMDRIFTKDLVLQIDLIFNHRPGPALRHEFAHGKMGDTVYGDPTVFYACCFMLYLTCAPLRAGWSEHVAPAIDLELF